MSAPFLHRESTDSEIRSMTKSSLCIKECVEFYPRGHYKRNAVYTQSYGGIFLQLLRQYITAGICI